MRIAMTFAVAAALASPAFAADVANDDAKKTICKSERFVGSNLRQRVCKTKAEWDKAKKDSIELLDKKNGKITMEQPKIPG